MLRKKAKNPRLLSIPSRIIRDEKAESITQHPTQLSIPSRIIRHVRLCSCCAFTRLSIPSRIILKRRGYGNYFAFFQFHQGLSKLSEAFNVNLNKLLSIPSRIILKGETNGLEHIWRNSFNSIKDYLIIDKEIKDLECIKDFQFHQGLSIVHAVAGFC